MTKFFTMIPSQKQRKWLRFPITSINYGEFIVDKWQRTVSTPTIASLDIGEDGMFTLVHQNGEGQKARVERFEKNAPAALRRLADIIERYERVKTEKRATSAEKEEHT